MIQFAIQSFSVTFGRVTFGLAAIVFRWCGPQTEIWKMVSITTWLCIQWKKPSWENKWGNRLWSFSTIFLTRFLLRFLSCGQRNPRMVIQFVKETRTWRNVFLCFQVQKKIEGTRREKAALSINRFLPLRPWTIYEPRCAELIRPASSEFMPSQLIATPPEMPSYISCNGLMETKDKY